MLKKGCWGVAEAALVQQGRFPISPILVGRVFDQFPDLPQLFFDFPLYFKPVALGQLRFVPLSLPAANFPSVDRPLRWRPVRLRVQADLFVSDPDLADLLHRHAVEIFEKTPLFEQLGERPDELFMP